MEIYSKAIGIAPENPRVVIEKARFNLESAKYTGGSTKSVCEDLQNAGKLLEDFKSDEPFYPNWGKNQLKKALTKCN